MSTLAVIPETHIRYPESDGKPMAENTIQFRWITTIKGNLDLLFHSRSDVFVAGDNLWYPMKGEPSICLAPDVYVVFGRPKGDRSSYLQWVECNVPLSVVFEIVSPGNTFDELLGKFEFYQQYGVQEYYLIHPEPKLVLEIYERQRNRLKAHHPKEDWVSPLLGVRFVTSSNAIVLYHPDGKPFLKFEELGVLQRRTEVDLAAARQRADAERQRADAERQRAEAERQRAEAERQRSDKLAAKLRGARRRS